MRRFEAEDRAVKPDDYEAWHDELTLMADSEGLWALVGMLWHSPVECCRYLQTVPGAWAELETRAHWADRRRFREGVRLGRAVGL